MYLRLYFLLPDEAHTRKLVDHLVDEGLGTKQLHAHMRTHPVGEHLPKATKWQKLDIARQVEDVAWRSDLVIFFVALAAFLYSVFTGNLVLSILFLSIMVISFLLGDLFAEHTPRVHLREFEDALSHGEVLLMVDVPRARVHEIESLVHDHHPAAIPGGSSWTIHSLGI